MKRLLFFLSPLFILTFFQLTHAGNITDQDELQGPYSTPELTWSTFRASLMEGDFATAEKCFHADKTNTVNKFRKMAENKRRDIILSMHELEEIELQENSAKYKLTRGTNNSNLTTYVNFQKIDNEWKIEKF